MEKGASLSQFRLVEKIGAGGMGEVWRATDTSLSRDVAIKVLPPNVAADGERLARLEREARLLASLNHPNIATLYGVERSGGVPCLVMELVDGETLADRLRRGPFSIREALEIGLQLASALEAAHEKGIVHRDLKPGNVKLTSEGRVKLLDFGLAQMACPERTPGVDSSASPTQAAPLTAEGAIFGSAPYMSPEQARGQATDRRTDIWAFGCVLFEMLAGRRVVAAAHFTDVVTAILTAEPEWGLLPAETPDRIRQLLQRCLRKDAARRLRDIGDARIEIEETIGETVSTPGTGTATPPSNVGARAPAARSAPRWPFVAAGLVVGAALALVAQALRTAGALPPAAGGRQARFLAVTNFSGVEAQPSLSPDGRSIVFVSNRDGRWDLYLGLVAGGTPIRLTDDSMMESRPRWSPDGTRILFSRLDELGISDLWVMPALGGPGRPLVRGGMTPAWAPDGKRIAYSSNGAIVIADADGREPKSLTTDDKDLFYYQPSFSRDGGSVVYVGRRSGPYSELFVTDLASGRTRQLTQDDALALSPVWSPAGDYVYYTSSRGGTLNVWKAPSRGGTPIAITLGQGDDTDIDLSADGTRLVFSSVRVNMNIAEMDLSAGAAGPPRWLTSDSARSEWSPRYSPDGRRIAYFSSRAGGEHEALWVMDADGRNAVRVVEDDRINVIPRWGPKGDQLIFISRTGGLGEGEVRTVSSSGGAPRALPITMSPWGSGLGDVSPDGRLIYQVSPHAWEIYDLQRGTKTAAPDVQGAPRWSSDGKSYAFSVAARPGHAEQAGLWVVDAGGGRKRVFEGWVLSFGWENDGSILVFEGKPDMREILWRLDPRTGSRASVMSLPMIMTHVHFNFGQSTYFDVDPAGRRIVMQAPEFYEADIEMIENVP